jgi:hypothetical protein
VVALNRQSSCETKPATSTSRLTAYELFESKKSHHTFTGYACRATKVGVQVQTFWTGATDTVHFKNPSVLSATECWSMAETKLCGQNPMTKQQNAWYFEKAPEKESSYWSTITHESLNCALRRSL